MQTADNGESQNSTPLKQINSNSKVSNDKNVTHKPATIPAQPKTPGQKISDNGTLKKRDSLVHKV